MRPKRKRRVGKRDSLGMRCRRGEGRGALAVLDEKGSTPARCAPTTRRYPVFGAGQLCWAHGGGRFHPPRLKPQWEICCRNGRDRLTAGGCGAPEPRRGEVIVSPLAQICSVCFEKYICVFFITSHCEWLIC